MKRVIFNKTRIEGYLYQHKLELKTAGERAKNPGTQFISGTVDVATNNEFTNIVSVHFTYVTPLTKDNKQNKTFATLMDIINGKLKSVMVDGKESAQKIAFDSAIGLNEFYSDRSGTEELVSVKRNEGGFITLLSELNEDEKARSSFDTDIILYKTRRIDADEEKQLPEKMILSGYIMNFRNDFLPVEYTVLNPAAMDYFESLEPSEKNPIFTRVRGCQVSQIIVNRVEEQGAFGDSYVKEYTNTHKDFVVTWAKQEVYDFGPEGEDLTPDDIKKGLANRETTIATIKKNRDEWVASKGAANTASAFASSSSDEKFHF